MTSWINEMPGKKIFFLLNVIFSVIKDKKKTQPNKPIFFNGYGVADLVFFHLESFHRFLGVTKWLWDWDSSSSLSMPSSSFSYVVSRTTRKEKADGNSSLAFDFLLSSEKMNTTNATANLLPITVYFCKFSSGKPLKRERC